MTKRQGRFFYGWRVVAASAVQGMFGNGTISSGFPIFFLPIQQALGVSYASMSLVFGLARAEGGMGGPVVGWLVDRIGSRPLILGGGLLAGVGMMLLSRADAYWQVMLLFVGVVSVGKTAGLGQTLMATVNQWFIRRKALALSTLMTSFAGGGAIVVPLLGLGIAYLGWRDTLLYTGMFMTVLTIPVWWVIRSKPEDMGLLPDGDASPPPRPGRGGGHGAPASSAGMDFTVRQALVTSAFWFLLLGVVTRVSATNAIIVHLFPILEDYDLTGPKAALYASLMFFLAIPLRFLLGVAGDVIAPRKLLFFGMNLGALGLLALLTVGAPWGVVLFLVCLAIVEGVTSVNWLVVGDYFGRARFATLMGLMSVFHNVGLLISPIFAGWVKDFTGAYDVVLISFMPMFVLSGVAFALARRPGVPKGAGAETSSSTAD